MMMMMMMMKVFEGLKLPGLLVKAVVILTIPGSLAINVTHGTHLEW